VTNEVSFLASTAAGERHCLGSTSGVLFADLVRASVDIDPIHNETSSRTRLFGRVGSPASQNYAKPQDSFPPKDLAKELFNHYFTHDHICYPFLRPASTFPIIGSIYNDASFYAKNPFQAFVFDMILAVSTVNVYKYEWQILPSAETHHTRAMNQAREVFQGGGLRGLQAILLLCQYRTSSSMQDTSASMWHLVGIAVRIAYELGLHRESAYDIRIGSDTGIDDSERAVNLEVRRRCFWSLLCMDR
jgi:Fungal specific transcription factor domain